MNLALFDFDGTITTRELMPDFVRMATTKRRRVIGQVVLAPAIVGYKAGIVSGNRVRERIADFAFRGLALRDVRAAGERFARDIVPATLRPESMARLQWHREKGDTIVVVSGSFDLYLSHFCAQHGLELLCSSLESRDGVMTGRYSGAQCVGVEKARRVRERYDLSRYPVVHAYGDTHEDRDLLALAHRRWYRGRQIA
ncbi:HAD family hydrolase [Lysobacter auxotrophicus]|uniref:HAD-IB family hydrolase n=1 Tax=Lysobacter auxotrophicus TaxID=2992573 RepID=A0ABN6UES5_9GAMM|nr:HAD family hydrolase [Lysobacter auxotrophicus]BDU14866.1 HAD-IB family hydrolase [Lysobacter auxotrophicus]